ncbi:hypothetical protein ACJX0J_037362, partial [Zea mays]
MSVKKGIYEVQGLAKTCTKRDRIPIQYFLDLRVPSYTWKDSSYGVKEKSFISSLKEGIEASEQAFLQWILTISISILSTVSSTVVPRNGYFDFVQGVALLPLMFT